jgi:hypothetical protein
MQLTWKGFSVVARFTMAMDQLYADLERKIANQPKEC